MTNGGRTGWFGLEDGEEIGEDTGDGETGEEDVSNVGDMTAAIFTMFAPRGQGSPRSNAGISAPNGLLQFLLSQI